ncbi:MAG: hypothetical protein EOO88_25410, partial [Pedobacter sp.]
MSDLQRGSILNYSEDEIRAKVVYHWLKNCGLRDSDIFIEHSIQLKLGHGIKTVNSRTDVLVKNGENNLLIVEVKAPSHQLHEKDKHQAISYARSLAEGGIAPFTILTNGKGCMIFDSVTGQHLQEVGTDHPYVVNGLRANGDAIIARAEALEYLISLSNENLLIFCKAQCAYRMKILKAEDIHSGKKYIPSLYTARKKPYSELTEQLFDSDSAKLVLVVGPPQHGKTCFLCNTVERYLSQGFPTLFYPAVSLKMGLTAAICEDFEWFFGEGMIPRRLVDRLRNILDRMSASLVIVVDGWNEMIDNAVAMNDECARLCESKLKFVISTTTTSLKRLLKDESGNESYVASATMLSSFQIQRLSTEPLINTGKAQIVQIGKFDHGELWEARQKYQQSFDVVFDEMSDLLKSPFYLRLAAEQFEHKSVPKLTTRAELIKESL